VWLHADIANVADIVRHHARTGPRRTALVEGRFTLSWGELDEVSSRLAAALRRAGVREGDVVAYLGRNSIPFFEVLYGAAKAGATLLPLNWRLAAPELAAIVEDAAPAVVFAEQDLLALLEASLAPTKRPGLPRAMLNPQAGVHGGLESYWDDSPADDPGGPSDPRGTAWLMYTSGTTGRAKGVELSHQGLDRMRLAEHFEPVFQWKSDDVLMMVMPNFHLLGTALPVQAMYNGCTVSIMPMLEPGRLLALVRETRPTILVVAPTVIQMMLDHPDAAGADLASLRLVMYAGSAISATLLKRALARFGCDFMQFYGATESGGAMSILRPEQHDLEDESKLRSCGTPLPLVDFRIAGAQGEELPDGQIGEIVVRSPALFTGYRNQREQTAAVLSQGWYRTGDAGYRDPKDGLYYIVDRVKDMIVTGGENVYSAEVEQAIQKHPGVAMSAVVAAPDERWGERVTAVIVPRPGVELTAEAIVAHCREHIAGYKVPKQVVFETTLPLSPAGKVLKRVLRDRFWEGHTRGVA
jgi:acyl-CoA synthetase (AMP-forming)/AMP-acid ligase II